MVIDGRRADSTPVKIGENSWLVCGLLWVVAGALTIAPLTIAARLGRSLLELMLLVHTIEAGYTTVRAWAAGLNMRPWFLRTIVLGSLAVFILEITLRRNIGEKEPA
jgi:4-hydroxybenzoate polyprenyltransferase